MAGSPNKRISRTTQDIQKLMESESVVELRRAWEEIVKPARSQADDDLKYGRMTADKHKAMRLLFEDIEGHFQDVIIRDLKNATYDEFVWVFESLRIRDDSFKIIRFKLKVSQHKILRAIYEQAKNEEPIRVVLLKARQFGGSTLVEALLYVCSRAMEGTRYGVVSHSTAGAGHLYGMYNTYWDHDKFHRERRYTKTGLEYKECGGKVLIESGYKAELWRGFTMKGLHLSEVAFWREPESAALAMLQAVPKQPMSIVVFESTANGVGDYFYRLWHRKNDGYVRVFVGWWEDPKYRSEFKSKAEKEAFEASMEPYEQSIKDTHELELEQLKWRRECISEQCNGDEDQFKQEYPTTPEEAFLHSGRSVFSGTLLNHVTKRSERFKALKRTWTGEIVVTVDYDNPRVYEKKKMSVNRGRLRIYEKPREGHFYAMGVDVSEGIEVDGATKHGGNRDSDNTAITILDCGDYNISQGDIPQILGYQKGEKSPMHEVCSWYGKIEPDDLAYLIDVLGKMYNMANIGIERNNHGLTTINILNDILRYPKSRQIKSSDFNEKYNRANTKIGWETTKMTRPYMVDMIVRNLRDDKLWMLSDEFPVEAGTFVIDKTGKPVAQIGCKDDKIISTCIACVVADRMPRVTPQGKRMDEIIGTAEQNLEAWANLKPGQSFAGMTAVGGTNKRRKRR